MYSKASPSELITRLIFEFHGRESENRGTTVTRDRAGKSVPIYRPQKGAHCVCRFVFAAKTNRGSPSAASDANIGCGSAALGDRWFKNVSRAWASVSRSDRPEDPSTQVAVEVEPDPGSG